MKTHAFLLAVQSKVHSYRVAIVGSGIGGLAAACALQSLVQSVVVFEADETFEARRQGFGLTLQDRRTLTMLDLIDAVEVRNTLSNSHYLFRCDGTVLGYFGRRFEECPEKRPKKRFNIRIPRETLRRLLLEKLHSPDVVRWGHRVHSYEERDGCVFIGGEEFDVLIGADGIFSSTRTQRFRSQSDELNYLECIIVLGLSPYRHELIEQRGFYTLDAEHGARLFTMPFSDTQTMWQLSFRYPDANAAKQLASDTPSLMTHLKEMTAQWHAPVAELLETTELSDVWATPLYDRLHSLSDLLKKGDKETHVTLLGDAAHPMSPFKGQGANQALLDAERLARWLAKASLPKSLRCYERELSQNAQVKVLASRDAAHFLHSPEATLQADTGALTERQVKAIQDAHLTANDAELDDKIALLLAKR